MTMQNKKFLKKNSFHQNFFAEFFFPFFCSDEVFCQHENKDNTKYLPKFITILINKNIVEYTAHCISNYHF